MSQQQSSTTDRPGGVLTRSVGPVVAAVCLALVGFSVLRDGAGAADNQDRARQVIGTDAQRATGSAKDWTRAYDASHR